MHPRPHALQNTNTEARSKKSHERLIYMHDGANTQTHTHTHGYLRACAHTHVFLERTIYNFVLILYVQDPFLNGQDDILFIPRQKIKTN